MRQAHLHSIAVIQRIGQYKYQNCNDMLAKKMPRKRNPFRDVKILSFDGFKVEESAQALAVFHCPTTAPRYFST